MAIFGSSVPEHRLALPIGFRLEGYRILRVLGQGGFGITYLAHDPGLTIEVAIKEMLPKEFATRTDNHQVVPLRPSTEQAFAWAKRRFTDEARILASLRHPNIVRVSRFFELHGTAYMVMEFVQGHDFRQWIHTHRKPTEQELTAILLPLMDGLGYLHRQGVLHRDISPEKIFS